MAAVKVVQKISSVTGSNSATIALKSGYIRVTPVADSFIEVGTGAEATSDSSLFVPADTSVVFKERVSSSDIVGITTGEASTTFSFPTGMESPFAVGDTIEVTGATGFNTTSATVTQNIPPILQALMDLMQVSLVKLLLVLRLVIKQLVQLLQHL